VQIDIRQVDVSFVITVFNKESQILSTIDSILNQTSSINCEFIFVDDASEDNSINIIKEKFKGKKSFTIIKNEENIGPSISLNKGCMAASGKYLFLIDGDDILIKNALEVMYKAITTEQADFVFGFHKSTSLEFSELLDMQLKNNSYKLSNKPLDTVLNGKYVRMAYLLSKELYLKSKGSDERIFIQDESLPLRLAHHSKKMVSLNSPVVYAYKNINSLSDNKSQQFHDRFYAYYFAFLEFKFLSLDQKAKIYKRAISTVWKAKKSSSSIIAKIIYFIFYLRVKIFPSSNPLKILKQNKKFIDKLENVRKIY
jgi:glycosyltransferase involved in cell wall biosynthesis